MMNDILINDWQILRSWLPADLIALALECGFFQRARGLTDADRWLRLILLHVAGGLSLELTVLRARELGWAQLSAMALFKRLRRAEPWLRALGQHLLEAQQRHLGRDLWPSPYQVRAIDATDIQSPGALGTDWRLHYSLRLPQLLCDHFELTDIHQGEKLGRFTFHPDELIVADRGYCHWAGAAQVLDSGAVLLVRLHPKLFPRCDPHGRAFDVLAQARDLLRCNAGQWPVHFLYQGKGYRLRLCAKRINALAAEHARERARRKAQAGGEPLNPYYLELAGYILVLTSLPYAFTASQVLELYPCRWQVELAFKRLKSLLGAGYVPKSTDPSARAWMQAKLLEALFLERLLVEAQIFEPGMNRCETLSQWRLVQEARDGLRRVLAPGLELGTFLYRGQALAQTFQIHRPHRPLQLTKASQILIP